MIERLKKEEGGEYEKVNSPSLCCRFGSGDDPVGPLFPCLRLFCLTGELFTLGFFFVGVVILDSSSVPRFFDDGGGSKTVIKIEKVGLER